jgi:hypothetical protein
MLHTMPLQTRKLLPILAVLLAACGAQQPSPTREPTLAPAPAQITTLQPPAATAIPTPTVAQLEAPALTQAATEAPLLPSATAPALPLYNGIPHGVTPDGFFFLGVPDAPVTLTDYSDFL